EANKPGTHWDREVKLPFFSFSSVSAATNNFSATNKLGEVGFGPVYKGILLNGNEIAVKRLSRRSGQGWEELKNEALLIAKLQHKNLVRLLGCCTELEKILIYEYITKKNLGFFIFDSTKRRSLDWGIRVRIVEGIAKGLLYLQFSRFRFIHRDLKASNILLDGNMNPKISDFGQARIFGGDELQANRKRIVGTYGYMPPEYALKGFYSEKSDVYSFRVSLLEIVSGRKNTSFHQSESLHLLGYAWDLWVSNRVLNLVDPLLGEVPTHMAMRYVNIGLLCVQENADDRQTMSGVVSMLNSESMILLSPKQPAF
ncbi:G-type lectin S-receptor-like serine/threonine-protein kinase RKS1, partial [Durio zibethinus]|uniref:non-specific serine/threonine protein kinase n=1 Tax=Durio zibethinus TaxID=66656 RepID=A0A6P5ZK89_DURZI